MASKSVILRTSYAISFIITGLIFVFALFSGAEAGGNDFNAVLKNSLNTIPWAILITLLLISLKWKKAGSIMLICYVLFMLYFFNFSGPNFFVFTFVVSLVLLFTSATILYLNLNRAA